MAGHELIGPPVSRAGPVSPKRSLLSRVGQGIVSFAADVPRSEIDIIRSERDIAAGQAELTQQAVETEQANILRQQQLEDLFGTITSRESTPEEKKQAAIEAAIINPGVVKDFFSAIGVTEQSEKNRIANRALEVSLQPTREAKNQTLQRQIAEGEAVGRNMLDSRRLIEASDEELDATLAFAQAAAIPPEKRVQKARKAPTTRTIIEGEETVDQQFNPVTGMFEEVGRGPRGVLQRIETGPPGSFSKTGTQRGKQIVEAENAAAATVQAIETAGELVNLVRSNESIIGKPGAFFRITNDLAQTAKGIARGFGVDITDTQFTRQTDPGNFDFSQFRGTAIESEVLRSGITSLAYAAATAAGQTGRSVSDRDIQRFINQIAGSTADPIAFERVIQSFTDRMARNFTIGMQARRIDRPDLTQLVLDSLDTVADEALREAQGIAGFDQLTPEDQNKLVDALRQRRR